MTRPAVSVILPVYNGARHLADALDSVLSQTVRALEVIVVDDGSTDESREIAVRFSSRVHYYRQPNQGTASARNWGVRLAAGDHLAFLDQDDLWLPDKLAIQTEALGSDGRLDAIFGQVEQFREVTGASPRILGRWRGCLPSALLVTRQGFDRVGWFDSRWVIGEWANWYVRAIESRLRFGHPAGLVARRRVHERNKGVLEAGRRLEYVRILKASLDRRRRTEYEALPLDL